MHKASMMITFNVRVERLIYISDHWLENSASCGTKKLKAHLVSD